MKNLYWLFTIPGFALAFLLLYSSNNDSEATANAQQSSPYAVMGVSRLRITFTDPNPPPSPCDSGNPR